MKLAIIALSISAAAMPLTHPNYQVSLPAPVIGQTYNLDLPLMQLQNPQWEVFFAGGLVGLFGPTWQAPIWTTPYVAWIPRDEPERVYLPPYIPPTVPDCPDEPEKPKPPKHHEVPEPSTALMVIVVTAIVLFCVWFRGRR